MATIGSNKPYGVPGFDIAAAARGANEARARGDVAGFLLAHGCPAHLAKHAAKREEYRRSMKPKTAEDRDLIERLVRTALELEPTENR